MDDRTPRAGNDTALIVPTRIVSPLGMLALLALAATVTVLAWPHPSDPTFVRCVGAGTLVVALAVVALGPRVPVRIVPLSALAFLGLALTVAGDGGVEWAGRVLGGVAIAWALVDGGIGVRLGRGARVARAVVALAAATTTLTAPRAMVSLMIGVVALTIAVGAIVVIGSLLDGRRTVAPTFTEVGGIVSSWLRERPTAGRERAEIRSQLLFEGRDEQSRLVRFSILMALASAIAAMGVRGDSTGVVIGAMLVAPLMTPLMAMSLSLVMGWPRRLGRHALVTAAGVAIAIGVSGLVGLIVPAGTDLSTNTQVLSRVTPTFLDLLIACAAGAAGAYAISRRDVADSLPGAAIAISLVPPLSVTGITLTAGDRTAAAGSFLLFATNAVAILVVGGLTFVLTGVAPLRAMSDIRQRSSTALAAIATITAVVLGGLFANGGAAAHNVLERSTIQDGVDDWLDPHPDHGLVRIDIGDDDVTVVVAGPTGDPPAAADLAPVLAEALDRDLQVTVRLVVEEIDHAEAGG